MFAIRFGALFRGTRRPSSARASALLGSGRVGSQSNSKERYLVRLIFGFLRWNGIMIDVTTSHLTTYTFNEVENVLTRKVQARETVEILEARVFSDLKVKVTNVM